MAQSIIDIIAREHRHIESLLAQLEREQSHDQRVQVFESLADMLIEHSRSEERVLYPQLAALSDFEKLAEDCVEDHAVQDQLLQNLSSRRTDEGDWPAVMASLEEAVGQHIRFEEDKVFQVLRQYFLVEELRIMGEEYLRIEGRVKQIQNVKHAIRNLMTFTLGER
ncbi:MAG: hemerythrin domain-containing protein [Bdellovibrionia bacterium]